MIDPRVLRDDPDRVRAAQAKRGLSALGSLLDAIPQPVWRRNRDGALAWVNLAYVAAVEAGTRENALEGGVELLDRQAREFIARDDAARLAAGNFYLVLDSRER